MAAHPARLRGCWAIHLPGEPVGVAVDLGPDTAVRGPRGCVCAHQLAFVVLTHIAEGWEFTGNLARARHARMLRLALLHGSAA